MAILKGMEVSVVVDGKALTEYDDEDAANENSDHPSEVSKYVEAVSDAEFSIDITVSRSYKFAADGLAFKLVLDGINVLMPLCRKAKLMELRRDWHGNIAGCRVTDGENWYLRPFKFKDIKIVEASTSTAGSRSVARLGTIRVDVFDVEVTRKTQDVSLTASLDQSEIAEKELIGRNVTLQSSFGESRPSKKLKYYESKPTFSFEIKYRSKKALQGLRLIPITPSPSPVPIPVPLEERPFDSLTPDEVQELARRFHAKCQAEREANIKPENVKSERGIKKELDHGYEDMIKSSTAKRIKTRPFEQGKIIELD